MGWSDIDINLTKQNDGDIKRDTYLNAVENSLNNIVTTMQGQRRMLPNFAIGIYSLLFEPLDESTAGELGEGIANAIERWEPRIIIVNLNVHIDYDKNLYECSLTYRVNTETESQTFNFVLEQIS